MVYWKQLLKLELAGLLNITDQLLDSEWATDSQGLSKQYFLNLFFGGKINRSKHLAEQYPLVCMRMTQNEF